MTPAEQLRAIADDCRSLRARLAPLLQGHHHSAERATLHATLSYHLHAAAREAETLADALATDPPPPE